VLVVAAIGSISSWFAAGCRWIVDGRVSRPGGLGAGLYYDRVGRESVGLLVDKECES